MVGIGVRVVLAAFLVMAVGFAGSAEAAVLRVPAATTDTYVRDGTYANTNYWASQLFVGSSTTASTKRRSLITFPITDYLPAGATITAAKVGMYVGARSTTKAISVGLYGATRAWTASATWNAADSGVPWTSPGGDFNATPIATNAAVGGALGTATWTIPLSTAQAWAQPAGTNLGVVVKQTIEGGANSNVLTIESADSATASQRPYIDVTYTPSTLTPGPADLVFGATKNAGARPGIWQANADGTNPQLVVAGDPTTTATEFQSPSLSPDGTKIAYTAGNKLFVRTIASAATSTVYSGPTPGAVRGVHFSPEGDKLIFLADVGGTPAIGRVLTVPVGGGTPTVVTIGSPAAGYPRDLNYSPNGDYLVFVSSDQLGYDAGVWVAASDGSEPRRVVYTDYFTRDLTLIQPRFESDGGSISFIDHAKLYHVDFNGGNQQQETGVLLGSINTPDWSGTSNRVTYTTTGSTPTRVGYIDYDQGTSGALFPTFASSSEASFRQPYDDGSNPDEMGILDEDPDSPIDTSAQDDGTCYDETATVVPCAPAARTAAPAATAAATGIPFDGISDSNRLSRYNMFADPAFTDLNMQYVRRIVPWNIALKGPADADFQDVRLWVISALQANKLPLISFEHCAGGDYLFTRGSQQLPCRPGKIGSTVYKRGYMPTQAEFRQAGATFMNYDADSNPDTPDLNNVPEYTAWNEPNLTNTQPTAATAYERSNGLIDPATVGLPGDTVSKKKAWLAGNYWAIASDECAKKPAANPNAPAWPPKGPCAVLAGDFTDGRMNNATNSASRGAEYLRWYRKGMLRPPGWAWAWHAYRDINIQKPKKAGASPRVPDYKALNAFLQATSRGDVASPLVMLTEQGLIRRRGTPTYNLPQNTMDAFKGLATIAPGRILRRYYYAMLGDGKWDSGLLDYAQPLNGGYAKRNPEYSMVKCGLPTCP